MATAASPFGDKEPGIQRGRGGFMRGGSGDSPYVSDPSGALVKSGPRKGEPKRIAYGSPSGFSKLIENTYNLQKWGERRLALGIGVDLALIADCHRLTLLDVDSDDYKTLADRIVVAAKDAAETSLAADRGTHGHAVLEDDDEGRNWIDRAEAGELLGIPVDAQHAIVQSWRDMLARNQLEILVTEASCVDDTWHLAGTLDNIARLGKDLRFTKPDGEIVAIPAGTVLVLDKKTGQRRTDRNGVIMYWSGYSVQVCSYAQSLPYDTVAETRGVWPWPIDQTHALIAHIDILGAINGAPSCELVYVDLNAGRHAGEIVCDAKAWEKRTDVFSVAQLEDLALSADAAPAAAVADGSDATDGAASPSVAPSIRTVPVVGVTFIDGYPANIKALAKAHAAGTELAVTLVRNPKNVHDANAIEVHVPHLGDKAMIGHVAKVDAAKLAPLLDAGTEFVASVYGVRVAAGKQDQPGIDIAISRAPSIVAGDTDGSDAPEASDALATSPATTLTGTSPSGDAPSDDQTRSPGPSEGAPSKLRKAQQARQAIDDQADANRPPIGSSRPDEGDDLSADTYASMWELMRTQFKALDRPALDWLSRLIREARDADVGFQAQACHTARRSNIYRALLALAARMTGTLPGMEAAEPEMDEIVRALAAHALNTDTVLLPTVTVGAAVGSMNAADAALFAQLATGQPIYGMSDAGQLVVADPNLAADAA